MQPSFPLFTESGPKAESNWRGVVLLGRNVQSYKFALARSLLDIAASGAIAVSLEDLALPFAHQLCDHLKLADKQGSSQSSTFLNACRASNDGECSEEELRTITIRQGFNNVLDAFHIVGQDPVPTRFFAVSGTGMNRIVHLTDEAIALATGPQAGNLQREADARWRLVETAWEIGVSTRVLSTIPITYNEMDELLYVGAGRRQSITGIRGAISGYQKGRCFYCNRGIDTEAGSPFLADVDHVFPHRLQRVLSATGPNLDGVWNLALACRDCNRGTGGKSDRLPHRDFLNRLWARNEYYIFSHHPLRETLILQTGRNLQQRVDFLNTVWREASALGLPSWSPVQVEESVWTAQP